MNVFSQCVVCHRVGSGGLVRHLLARVLKNKECVH